MLLQMELIRVEPINVPMFLTRIEGAVQLRDEQIMILIRCEWDCVTAHRGERISIFEVRLDVKKVLARMRSNQFSFIAMVFRVASGPIFDHPYFLCLTQYKVISMVAVSGVHIRGRVCRSPLTALLNSCHVQNAYRCTVCHYGMTSPVSTSLSAKMETPR